MWTVRKVRDDSAEHLPGLETWMLEKTDHDVAQVFINISHHMLRAVRPPLYPIAPNDTLARPENKFE
jgi:hypothetical protein